MILFTKHIDRYKDNEMLYLEKKNVSVVTRTKDDHGGNAQTGGWTLGRRAESDNEWGFSCCVLEQDITLTVPLVNVVTREPSALSFLHFLVVSGEDVLA